MSEAKNWLIKFGFGGVQQFISNARKTRDLAASSALISEMAKAAGVFAQSNPDAVLLRPTSTSISHWPHQLILRLNHANEEKVRELAEGMCKAKIDHWINVQANELSTHEAYRLSKDFESQLSVSEARVPPVEHFWVAVPFSEETELRSAMQSLGESYERRKFTRTFSQLEIPPVNSKLTWTCTLCSNSRASLVPASKWPENQLIFRGSEKLCLNCATKRLWKGDGTLTSIPSTHAIARDRFDTDDEFKSTRDKLKSKVSDFLNYVDEASNLSESSEPPSAEHTLGKVWRDFQELTKHEQQALFSLPPYFAVILYDGDEMGKWFAGTKLKPDLSFEKYSAIQNQLSNALLEFSQAIEQTGGNYRSTVVYAGGDEGLILCPLDHVLGLIDKIKCLWDQYVANSVDTEHCVDEKQPTLSLQVVVGHAKSPLQQLVSAVHHELSESKDLANRNCIAIQIRSGSGAPAKVVMPWSDLDNLVCTIEALSNWRKSGKPTGTSKLPSSLPYKILGILDWYFEPTGNQCLKLVAMFGRELNRLAAAEKGDCNDLDFLTNWIAARGEFNPQYTKLNGRHTVEGILKVTSTLARWLDRKDSNVKI